jgi:predicted nucleotidyltransferase
VADKASSLPVIDQKLIDEIVARLLEAAPPGSKVILFGSQARGDADRLSDVDVMVVEPEVENTTKEALRLDHALDSLRIPVDLIVTSVATFDYWKETVNTLYYRAVREGKTYETPG